MDLEMYRIIDSYKNGYLKRKSQDYFLQYLEIVIYLDLAPQSILSLESIVVVRTQVLIE
jgi:hypothetical protein